MSEPDLRRVYNAVMDSGKNVSRLAGNGFRSACPAHDGDGMSVTWRQEPSGKIAFHCYSHDCSMRDMMDALDLSTADFIPSRDRVRPTYNPSEDQCFVAYCDSARKRGERLSRQDRDRERQAMLNLKRLDRQNERA